MRRILTISSLCLALAGSLGAQNIPGLKTYNTQEEYCADQPHAPTCLNGKPLKMLDRTKPSFKTPGPVPPQRMRAVQPTAAEPMAKPLNLAADWRFAHPRAEMLAGINVESLLHSPALIELLGELAGRFQIHVADLDSALAKANGVKQVWISFRAGDTLLLVQGRPDIFQNMPKGFVKVQNGMISCRISDTAVLMGKEASVLAAVQRLQDTKAAEPATAGVIKNLSAENQFWLTGSQALIKQAKPSPTTADVSGFSLAMQLRDGFRMEAILQCVTPAAAQRVLASAQQHPPPNAAMKVDTRLEGSSVRFTLAIDKAQFSQVIEKALASPMAQRLTAMAARKPPSASGAGNALGSGTIEIQGLPQVARHLPSSGEVVAAPSQPSTKLEGGITIQGGSSSRR